MLTNSKQVEVSPPDLFLCPISLELMRDPVTLTTGQTYDRSSIEKWFETGHHTCPRTMSVLSEKDVIPNHALRRLIQAWCDSNHCYGVERIPTPKQSLESGQAKTLLERVAKCRDAHDALKRLRSAARESERNRKVIVDAGGISIVGNFMATPMSFVSQLENLTSQKGSRASCVEICEDAIGLLVLLPAISVKKLFRADSQVLTAIVWVVCRGSLDGRVNAALFLASLATSHVMRVFIGRTPGVFPGLVKLLGEDLYPPSVRAGLKALLALSVIKENSAKVVQADAIPALVELLPSAERSNTERALMLLAILCEKEEGRAALKKHALTVPVLVRTVLSVSGLATEKAICCLWAVCQDSPKLLEEVAAQAGVWTQLLHFIQADCRLETKLKAEDLLKQLRQEWKNCDRKSRSD